MRHLDSVPDFVTDDQRDHVAVSCLILNDVAIARWIRDVVARRTQVTDLANVNLDRTTVVRCAGVWTTRPTKPRGSTGVHEHLPNDHRLLWHECAGCIEIDDPALVHFCREQPVFVERKIDGVTDVVRGHVRVDKQIFYGRVGSSVFSPDDKPPVLVKRGQAISGRTATQREVLESCRVP
jgi:hypothetical protein